MEVELKQGWLLGLVMVTAAACSGSSNENTQGTTGGVGAVTGGIGAVTGGAGVETGGALVLSGGVQGATGGSTLTGGTTMTGGAVMTGGDAMTGGDTMTGGTMMTGGTTDAGMMTSDGCTPAPSGMFTTTTVMNTGPDGNYTVVRPATLGENGFLHPPVAWGNGLGTTPTSYVELLDNVASHGFVVIANPGTGSDPQVVRQGLEWLIDQNGSGDYAGKLAVDCAGTIGYSMGGGAAVGSGAHPAVKAIVSIHGLEDAAESASGPILLTTSDDDGFVTKSGYVQPCYDRSSVQPTILATHITGNAASFNGHLEPIGAGGADAEPAIAWLRFWIYGDESQRDWFFGTDCKVCVSPWADVQKKNYNWD